MTVWEYLSLVHMTKEDWDTYFMIAGMLIGSYIAIRIFK